MERQKLNALQEKRTAPTLLETKVPDASVGHCPTMPTHECPCLGIEAKLGPVLLEQTILWLSSSWVSVRVHLRKEM